MRLNDYYCASCGRTLYDVYDDDETNVICECGSSDVKKICNGGTKSRVHINDWPSDPDFYKGQIKYMGGTAEADNKDVRTDMYKKNEPKRELRNDQIEFKHRQRRGKNTLYF
jgi:hypothetical protein